ncbi:heavy metal translocating P-type ATPase [Anaerocolumna sp. AGMB13025]|nr:heavy metal translocating P-type ATPase [Anaerocolumna sp. AGMB13025]WFR58882.1 heavy metal translocating P-type ATPase [Anaerocolumna sp. AGMB13025]
MKLTSNQKRLLKTLIGAAIYAVGIFYKTDNRMISLVIFLAAYGIIGGDVLWRAVRNIFRGQVFDENFLMSVATVGAFFVGDFAEGVAVMLFYQVGELFQSYAVDKSRKSIASLMDIRPDYANVKRGDNLEKVDPDEVQIDEIIVIKAGEKVPLDAIVIEGSSTVDTSALTGESLPREVTEGDSLLSGCININGLLTARVIKEFGESTVSKILDLVENAGTKKSNSENFITKFARYYTPVVVIVAALMAVIPPLVIPGATFSDWIYRGLIFLVISCPCALVISIPLSFFGGIGGASRRGILVKGSNYLEALAQTEVVVFDKTGTLTKGIFKVQEVVPQNIEKEELLELTAYAESYSNHPISISLKKAYGKEIDSTRISNVEEIPGHGVTAIVDGKTVSAGNVKLMKKLNVSYQESEDIIGTVVHVAIDGSYRGYIVIADEVKEDAALAIRELKAAHIRETVMLTGDAKKIGEKIAVQLGLDKVYTELLPGDKVQQVEELFKTKSAKGKLAFVGDGINDAPVLARADIGIAMGGLGSDAAIEAADIVIMTDEPSKLATAIKLSKKTLRIVKQNITFALAVKAVVLLMGALGMATMWAAIFADVGVAILAILNAIRMLNVKKIN